MADLSIADEEGLEEDYIMRSDTSNSGRDSDHSAVRPFVSLRDVSVLNREQSYKYQPMHLRFSILSKGSTNVKTSFKSGGHGASTSEDYGSVNKKSSTDTHGHLHSIPEQKDEANGSP